MRWRTCIKRSGDYVEKHCRYIEFFCANKLWEKMLRSSSLSPSYMCMDYIFSHGVVRLDETRHIMAGTNKILQRLRAGMGEKPLRLKRKGTVGGGGQDDERISSLWMEATNPQSMCNKDSLHKGYGTLPPEISQSSFFLLYLH